MRLKDGYKNNPQLDFVHKNKTVFLCTSTNATILVNRYVYNITRLMREILYLSKNADHETKVPLSCGGDPSQPGEPTRLTETTLRWHPYLGA